jgi:hypothetical protein
LKTNLDVHIAHIRDSGVVDANRLVKLLRVRKALHVKQFAFELLIVKLLSGSTRKSLEDQLQHALGRIAESELAIPVEDPANPFGNDLSKLISDAWPDLLATARSVLDTIERSGWEAVFGTIDEVSKGQRIARATVSRVLSNVRRSRGAHEEGVV